MADSREVIRAADQLASAARELARQMEESIEFPSPASEEEADRLGVEAVHRPRSEWLIGAGGFDRDEITESEAKEWTRRREERRRREGYNPPAR